MKQSLIVLIVLSSCFTKAKDFRLEQHLDLVVLNSSDSSIIDTSLFKIKSIYPIEKTMNKRNLLLDAYTDSTIFEFKTIAKTDTFVLHYKKRINDYFNEVEFENIRYYSLSKLKAVLYKEGTTRIIGNKFITFYIP